VSLFGPIVCIIIQFSTMKYIWKNSKEAGCSAIPRAILLSATELNMIAINHIRAEDLKYSQERKLSCTDNPEYYPLTYFLLTILEVAWSVWFYKHSSLQTNALFIIKLALSIASIVHLVITIFQYFCIYWKWTGQLRWKDPSLDKWSWANPDFITSIVVNLDWHKQVRVFRMMGIQELIENRKDTTGA